MSLGMQKSIVVFSVISLACLLSTTASALIEVFEGNEPVRNMGWPTGAEEVANLPSRLGYMVGPPFGGGEYYFEYQSKGTNEFNSALQKFSAMQVPRMTRQSLISLDGQRTQIADDKPLLLVVHDWPKDGYDEENAKEAGKDKSRVDWTFTIWTPENFYSLFSNPKGGFDSDHPNYRQPVPSPRIDVYVGGGGPIQWEKGEVPPNIRVIDKRIEAAPVSTDDGGVIRGGVYDMATHQVVAGANVILVQRTEPRRWEETVRTKTDDNGLFMVRAIPEGYFEIHIDAEGYVARNVGVFDNRIGRAYYDFDALLVGKTSLNGVVTDKKGNPIPGVEVSAEETLGIDGLGYQCVDKPSAMTDDQGRFELHSLPEGFAHLRCRAPSLHQETSIFELYKISAKPWEKPNDIKIIMTGTGIVRGKVVGGHGKAPTREFIVELEPKGGHRIGSWGGSMQCKKNGEFEFKGVPPGEYFVIAKPNPMREREASAPKPVIIVTGKTVELEIVNAYAHKAIGR